MNDVRKPQQINTFNKSTKKKQTKPIKSKSCWFKNESIWMFRYRWLDKRIGLIENLKGQSTKDRFTQVSIILLCKKKYMGVYNFALINNLRLGRSGVVFVSDRFLFVSRLSCPSYYFSRRKWNVFEKHLVENPFIRSRSVI